MRVSILRAVLASGLALALALATGAKALAATDCGGPAAPCRVEGGAYHMSLPDDPSGAPVLVWLHGYGGQGASSVKKGMIGDRAAARGFVFVAPNALKRPGGRATAWAIRNGLEPHRDELAFIRRVVADVVARTGADGARVMLSGFSLGGSMVWDVACAAPSDFIAFAPLAGAFWRPLPERCAGPVRLFHAHGTADKTVPIEGRAVMDGRLRQGDMHESLEILARANGCPADAKKPVAENPEAAPARFEFWRWEGCQAGSELTLALHPGAHGLPEGWWDRMLDWFESLPR